MMYKSSVKCIVLALILTHSCFVLSQNSNVSVQQSGDSISWFVSGTTYTVESVGITILGPTGSSSSNVNCESNPVNCSLNFLGTGGVLNTGSLSPGSYNWQLSIVPQVNPNACDPTDVRNNQGGYQGLTGGSSPNFEELYEHCLKVNGILPLDSNELNDSGSFLIQATGLIVPDDDNTNLTDNNSPIALCKPVTVEGSLLACMVDVDINNGSNDSDGQLVSLVQEPAGPYGLGDTNVTLTVTDDMGASANCSAIVTVTDSQEPTVSCPSDNTMTPPTAPKTFSSQAADSCGIPTTKVVGYDCYRFNKKGKRIDTNDSCVVELSDNSITVIETSGVDSFIDWSVEATDSSGNSSEATCTVEVLHPNS